MTDTRGPAPAHVLPLILAIVSVHTPVLARADAPAGQCDYWGDEVVDEDGDARLLIGLGGQPTRTYAHLGWAGRERELIEKAARIPVELSLLRLGGYPRLNLWRLGDRVCLSTVETCEQDGRTVGCRGNSLCLGQSEVPAGALPALRRYRDALAALKNAEANAGQLGEDVRWAFPDLISSLKLAIGLAGVGQPRVPALYRDVHGRIDCGTLHEIAAEEEARLKWAKFIQRLADPLRTREFDGLDLPAAKHLAIVSRSAVATAEVWFGEQRPRPPLQSFENESDLGTAWPGGRLPVLVKRNGLRTTWTSSEAIHLAGKYAGFRAYPIVPAGLSEPAVYVLVRDEEPPTCSLEVRRWSDRLEVTVTSNDGWADRSVGLLWPAQSQSVAAATATFRVPSTGSPNLNVDVKARCVDAAGNSTEAMATVASCEWQCRTGECLGSRQKCDGRKDCPGGEDEASPPCEDEPSCRKPLANPYAWNPRLRRCEGRLESPLRINGEQLVRDWWCPYGWQEDWSTQRCEKER